MLASWKDSYDKCRQCIEEQRHHFADRGLYSQSCGFSSCPVGMWELDHKQRWGPKNWCFWIVVLEKDLESPLDCKEIKPVDPKGNQLSMETTTQWKRLMLMLNLQYFGHLIQRADSLEKTLMLRKIEGRRKKGVTEDEMVV